MAGSSLRNNLLLIWWDQWEHRKLSDLHLFSYRHLLPSIPPSWPTWKTPIIVINHFQSRPLVATVTLNIQVEHYILLSREMGTKHDFFFFLERILIKCCHLQRRDNYKDPWWHAVQAGARDRRRRDDYYYCIIWIRLVCSVLCSKPWRSG